MTKKSVMFFILTSLFISGIAQAEVCSSRFQILRTEEGIQDAELCYESVYEDSSDYVSFENPYYKIPGRLLSKRIPIATFGLGDLAYCRAMGFPYVGYRVSEELFLNKLLRIDAKSIASANKGGVTVVPAENMLILKSLTCTDSIDKVY